MENLLFLAPIAFVAAMIYAYRHDMRHAIKKIYYGKEKYAAMKSILYGNYEEFRAGCYQLIRFRKISLGGVTYGYPSENEKKMIVEVARKNGWLLRFVADTSEDMRRVFIYPENIKETEIFSPIF